MLVYVQPEGVLLNEKNLLAKSSALLTSNCHIYIYIYICISQPLSDAIDLHLVNTARVASLTCCVSKDTVLSVTIHDLGVNAIQRT